MCIRDSADAALHAGTTMEVMAKAVLASIDPRLILEGQTVHHALLHEAAAK